MTGGLFALDVATTTGWAYGMPGDRPSYGRFRSGKPRPKDSEGNIGEALRAFCLWLGARCIEWQPSMIVFEAPYVPRFAPKKVRTRTGQVVSTIEQFKITSVESTNPHVNVTSVPLDPLTLIGLHGKAGFEFTVKADRGMPIGTFRVPVRIHTTLEGSKTIEIDVTGTRSGPMLFLPPRGKGLWLAEKSRLNMGRVRREVGSKVSLPAIIYGIKDKFKVLKTTSDAEYLKVSIEPNPEIAQGEQQGVLFVFELPKDSPGETRVTPNGVHVTLETNHPKLKDIHFEVEFICQ